MAMPTGNLRSLISGNRGAVIAGAAILAGGLAFSSAVLANGLVQMQRTDREVTVRGVAQRDVTANRASWAVGYSQTAYSLSEALAASDRDTGLIRRYLAGHGFGSSETRPGSASISSHAETVDDRPTGRTVYSVSRTISLSTGAVARVVAAEAGKDALAQQGLVVDYTSASYRYTRLDTIKPAMIAAATRDAREAANKFAEDSGAEVGGIRSATQGYF